MDAIEAKVKKEEGWQGRNIFKKIPKDLVLAVKAMVGRVFIINPDTNMVVHTGSGMILPDYTKASKVHNYQHIITCRHVLLAPTEDKVKYFKNLKCYFVHFSALSSSTTNVVSLEKPPLKTPYNYEEGTTENGCFHPEALKSFESPPLIKERDYEDNHYKNKFKLYLYIKSKQSNKNVVREIDIPSEICGLDALLECNLKKPFNKEVLDVSCEGIRISKISYSHHDAMSGHYYAFGFPKYRYLLNLVDEYNYNQLIYF